MSHFEDVEGLVWFGPVGILGLAVAIVAVIWAVCADNQSARECERSG